MSAAALTAHEIPSEPDCKQSRELRDRISDTNIRGSSRHAQMRRVPLTVQAPAPLRALAAAL